MTLSRSSRDGNLRNEVPEEEFLRCSSSKSHIVNQNIAEKKSNDYPTSRVEIMVNATQKCNLTCRYCFVGAGRFDYSKKYTKKLHPRTAQFLIEILPKRLPWAKHFCVHFYGGEPLLNLDAIEAAVDAALPKGKLFSFAITTNGTVSTKRAISILKKGRFNVILSIDGPASIHDELRRTKLNKPTHKKVLTFLKKVKDQNLFVRGSSVIRNGWSLHEATKYLKTLRVDAIKAQAVRLPINNPLALNQDQRNQYFSQLENVAAQTVEHIKKNMYPKDDRFTNRILQILSSKRRDSFCGAGKWTFGMASDGTIFPCVLLAGKEDTILGDISDKGEWVKEGLKWAFDHQPRKSCQECWALPLCGGGCPSMLSVCGDDECELVRKNCELALGIYGSFLDRQEDLLVLAGIT
jgi:uncharacterized protein